MIRRGFAWVAGLATLALIAGCATPYQERGYTGGFQERQVGPNRWYVEFFGNGHTNRDTVSGFWLYRCAELTVQKGFDYFVIVGKKPAAGAELEDEGEGRIIRTRGGGGSSVPIYVPGGTITTWSSRGVIEMYRGDAEADDRPAFTARDIIAKLDGPVKQATSSGKNLVLPADLFARPERPGPQQTGGGGKSGSGVNLRDLDGLLPKQ